MPRAVKYFVPTRLSYLFVLLLWQCNVCLAASREDLRELRKSHFDYHQLETLAPFANPGDDYGIDSAYDASGNVYVTGTTFGTLPGNSSAGGYDCFLAKYNTSGTQQWVKQFGTSALDVCLGAAVDSANNIYVVGYTIGSFSGFTNAGLSDIILAKYTSAGVQTYVKQIGTSGDDLAYSVVVDSSDRPLFCGITTGSFSGFTNFGGEDAFITRYTTAGALSFLEQFGTAGNDRGIKLNIDASNRTFVAGTTTGTFTGETNAGGVDSFVTRYNSNGRKSWLKQFGTAGDDYAWAISAVTTSGITNTTGITTGSFSGFTNAGGEDFFIIRFSLTGVQSWVTQGGTSSDDEATSAFSDSSGNTYITGLTYGSFPTYTNQGEGDGFLAKYSSAGAQTWLRQIGTIGDDFFYGIKGDSTGESYITGSTDAAVSGGTNLNGYDIILSEYNSSGTQQWIKQFGTN